MKYTKSLVTKNQEFQYQDETLKKALIGVSQGQ